MSKTKKPALPPRRGSLTPARIFLFIAMAAVAYLAWRSLNGASLPGCGPASSCDKVLQSRWAFFLNLPVSVPALLVYIILLGATFFTDDAEPAVRRLAWQGIIGLCILISGAALWFTGIQLFQLRAVCPFCMTAHVSGLVAAALLVRAALRHRPIDSGNSVAEKSPRLMFAGLIGMIAVAGLIAAQLLIQKPTFQVKNLAESPSAPPPKPESRLWPLHGGRFQLNLHELPMIGSPNAPQIVVSLFDYSCHYCRDMHGLLVEAQHRYSNQLGIVNLPNPLSTDCNRVITRTSPAHREACEYARFGLAVWRAKPQAIAQFDTWIFAPPSPPPLNEVRQFAEQLVGPEKLNQALADEWVKRQIEMVADIYEANGRTVGNLAMPQLILGTAISTGPIQRMEDLDRLLNANLQLKPQP